MAATAMTMVLGSARSWKLTARANNAALTGVFTGSDALDAKVYRGDGQSPLFAPDVAWVDAAAATIRLTVTAAMTSGAGLTAGKYRVEVGVTPVSDGLRREVHYGDLYLRGTSGTASALPSIAAWADVVAYSGEVVNLETLDTDLTQFAGQRNEAMGLFIQEVVRRYAPRPGGSRRYVSADGSSAGPYLRFAPSPDGSPPPTRAQVEAWLNDPGRLKANRDVVEANARIAAALVYGASAGANNPYQQMGDKERELAREAVRRAAVEIDTKDSPDGSPTIRVDRDVVYLT